MKYRKLLVLSATVIAAFASVQAFAAMPEKGPVKVFLLVGQSNMEGMAANDTLNALKEDPKTLADYNRLKNGDQWTVRKDVWVYYPRSGGVAKGPLTVGFGGSDKTTGPELGIGMELGDFYKNQQVLLIKSAWGGKSVKKDFLPPSEGGPGEFYTKTIQQTRDALKNLKADFPDYDGKGYEIAGMVWFQGWNDAGNKDYAQQLAALIRDIRKEFNVPKMPVVIGQMGHGGMKTPIHPGSVAAAQADVPKMQEFKDNVLCVSTREYWDEEAAEIFPVFRQCKGATGRAKQQGKSEAEVKACWDPWKKVEGRWKEIGGNYPFHYCGSGRCFWGMGKAMGDGMVELLKNEK